MNYTNLDSVHTTVRNTKKTLFKISYLLVCTKFKNIITKLKYHGIFLGSFLRSVQYSIGLNVKKVVCVGVRSFNVDFSQEYLMAC